MKVTLNIGMNNNPLHWLYISRKLAYHTHGVTLKYSRLETSTYKDTTEETLVVKMKTNMSVPELESFLELLCMALTQECIAYRTKGIIQISRLVYNPTYEGKHEKFNDEYFIRK